VLARAVATCLGDSDSLRGLAHAARPAALGRDEPPGLPHATRTMPTGGDGARRLDLRRAALRGVPAGHLGLALGGGTLGGTAGRLLFGCHVLLTSDYCADAFAERNCSFDRKPLRIELPKADVLVGDVHFAGLEAVTLGPCLRLLDGPACGSVEEQRLRPHGRGLALGFDDIRIRRRWRRWRWGNVRSVRARDDGADTHFATTRRRRAARCGVVGRSRARGASRTPAGAFARSGEFGETRVVHAHVFNVTERPNALLERQLVFWRARVRTRVDRARRVGTRGCFG